MYSAGQGKLHLYLRHTTPLNKNTLDDKLRFLVSEKGDSAQELTQ